MKKIIATLSICIISITVLMGQNNDVLIIKRDYILINMKCSTAYRNFQATGKEYAEVNKVLLRTKAILYVVEHNNELIITTSEFSWGNTTNVSKHYLFKFPDSDSVNIFYQSLVDKLELVSYCKPLNPSLLASTTHDQK